MTRADLEALMGVAYDTAIELGCSPDEAALYAQEFVAVLTERLVSSN